MIVLFAVLAIGAVLLLDRIVGEIDEIKATSTTYIAHLHDLGGRISAVESALYASDSDSPSQEELKRLAGDLRSSLDPLQADALNWPEGSEAPAILTRILASLPGFADRIDALALTNGPGTYYTARDEVLRSHIALQTDVLDLTRLARAFASDSQTAMTNRFRWVVLGVAIASILVVNISILVVLRTVGLVLRPMEEIVDATTVWSGERFDHRIALDQPDEFGQLARALNQMADRLEVNETRKIETLQQTARMLNHELNNALAIISLQVQLLDRSRNASPELKDRLDRIRACLARMTNTVDSLKQVRRIVLTDYVPGEKMLDLPRSISEAADSDEGPREAEIAVVSTLSSTPTRQGSEHS